MKELSLDQLTAHSITETELNNVLGGNDCDCECYEVTYKNGIPYYKQIPCP